VGVKVLFVIKGLGEALGGILGIDRGTDRNRYPLPPREGWPRAEPELAEPGACTPAQRSGHYDGKDLLPGPPSGVL
jgi:hypothetical protein